MDALYLEVFKARVDGSLSLGFCPSPWQGKGVGTK